MPKFLIVVEPFGAEMWVEAATEKEAYKNAWNALTDDQKDATECLDCIDVVGAA